MTYDRSNKPEGKTAAVQPHPMSKIATWWKGAPLPQMGTHISFTQPNNWFGVPMLMKAMAIVQRHHFRSSLGEEGA